MRLLVRMLLLLALTANVFAIWSCGGGSGSTTMPGQLVDPRQQRSANAPTVVAEFALPTADSGPLAIAAGPDGNLWFTEATSGTVGIGRITTSGSITEFTLAPSFPDGITAGPDGAMWFSEGVASKIGRITTTGSITEFAIPTANSGPGGITTGPDGNLWFTEGGGNKIARITPRGSVCEFALPHPFSGPVDIAKGPDGNLWFTEETIPSGNRIGKITT